MEDGLSIPNCRIHTGSISSRLSLQRVPCTGKLVFYGPTSNKDLVLLLPNCSSDQFSCTSDATLSSQLIIDMNLLETHEDQAQRCLRDRKPSYTKSPAYQELAKQNTSIESSLLLLRFAVVAAGAAYLTPECEGLQGGGYRRGTDVSCKAYEQCELFCGPELGQCNTVLVDIFVLIAHHAKFDSGDNIFE